MAATSVSHLRSDERRRLSEPVRASAYPDHSYRRRALGRRFRRRWRVSAFFVHGFKTQRAFSRGYSSARNCSIDCGPDWPKFFSKARPRRVRRAYSHSLSSMAKYIFLQ